MQSLASDGASPREVLGRAVKISGYINIVLGTIAMLTATIALQQLLYRFIMGGYLVGVGVLGLQLGSSATGAGSVSPVLARMHFFMSTVACIILCVVNLSTLIMNEALADLMCATIERESCSVARGWLVAFSVVYLVVGVCVLGPLAYIAKRFYDEMQETSQWGRQVQLPAAAQSKALAGETNL